MCGALTKAAAPANSSLLVLQELETSGEKKENHGGGRYWWLETSDFVVLKV